MYYFISSHGQYLTKHSRTHRTRKMNRLSYENSSSIADFLLLVVDELHRQ